MSTLYMFPPSEQPAEDVEVLAGEYVLGVMDPGEAAATRLRADSDPVLLGAIGVWQTRLAPLTAMLPQPPPPATLWTRLAATIGMVEEDEPVPVEAKPVEARPVAQPEAEPQPSPPAALVEDVAPAPDLAEPEPPTQSVAVTEQEPEAEPPAAAIIPLPEWIEPPPPEPHPPEPTPLALPPRLIDRVALWRGTTAASAAAALGLAAWIAMGHAEAPGAVAAIGVVNAPAPIYLAESDAAGHLRVTPLATIAVPNGRDLQLWMIRPGTQDPTSLGVLPPGGRIVDLGGPPTEGTRFVVSMEPRGGAPSGRITGQVLYGGTLANR